MNPYVMHDLALQRERDVSRRAARSGLVALARCCRPSQLARVARGLVGPRARVAACGC